MVNQVKDPVFWELFWNVGGRFLLILAAVYVTLLIGILMYGNIKNRRNRGKVSSSNRRWINQTTKRRRLFDGMEVLETSQERLSPRLNFKTTRSISPQKDLFVTDANGLRRIDRATLDSLYRTRSEREKLRLDQVQLSPTTVSERPLSSTFNGKQII